MTKKRTKSHNPTRVRESRTAQLRAAFLRCFARTGNVSESCRLTKRGKDGPMLSRRTVYDWLEEDESFAKLFDEALEEAIDALEEEARKRAVDGVLKPVYQGGRKVGVVCEKSDTLLLAMLKARRPKFYRDRVDANVTVSADVDAVAMLQSARRRAPMPE